MKRNTKARESALSMAARPLYSVCCVRYKEIKEEPSTASGPQLLGFAEPSGGPYFILALLLDVNSLCRMDATCRLLRQLSRATMGPWRELGASAYRGMELERDGTFEQPESADIQSNSRKLTRVDWKGRFQHFKHNIPTFCTPFGGHEITCVAHPDEVAYLRCRLCTDVVRASTQGVYLEVEVATNPDNLSMAVVDFEAGGCSSVTFSPDTGAVIRERKVREAPRKVEGAYIQPLPTVTTGRPFHGLMGLYLCKDRLAFFRRCQVPAAPVEGGAQSDSNTPPGLAGGRFFPPLRGRPEPDPTEMGPWETTGFVSDLDWAEGRRLTPCLAFRDEGAYRVRIVRIGATPPIDVQSASQSGSKIREQDWRTSWSGFDWEVGSTELAAPTST